MLTRIEIDLTEAENNGLISFGLFLDLVLAGFESLVFLKYKDTLLSTVLAKRNNQYLRIKI